MSTDPPENHIHYAICPTRGGSNPACDCLENRGARLPDGSPRAQAAPFDEARLRAVPGPPLPPLRPSLSPTAYVCCDGLKRPAWAAEAACVGCSGPHKAYWCPVCYRAEIAPDPPEPCQVAWRTLFWLQREFPLVPREKRPQPVMCRACGVPYHVELLTDPAGQAWIALCLSCGEYEFHGRADYCETVLLDLVRELKPEFRSRSMWQRLKAWWRR